MKIIEASYHDSTYLNLVKEVMTGTRRVDRTGTGTISRFGLQARYQLYGRFPLLLSKQVPWKVTVSELLWFLEGSTNERRLAELYYGKPRSELTGKRTIWTDNAEAYDWGVDGDLGEIYGYNWRNFSDRCDQIVKVIEGLKSDPFSRRHLVTAYDPTTTGALPPCHTMFQFYVRDVNGLKFLDCMMFQRSADMALGVPVNIASYALLTYLIARECNMYPGEFVHSIGDAHIYLDHVDGLQKQIKRWAIAEDYHRAHFSLYRDGKTSTVFSGEEIQKLFDCDEVDVAFRAPRLGIDEDFDLMNGLMSGFNFDDVNKIKIMGYKPLPSIKFKMSV